jgi:hypothetical protein
MKFLPLSRFPNWALESVDRRKSAPTAPHFLRTFRFGSRLDSAETTENLSPIGDISTSERQTRPLAGLEPEEPHVRWCGGSGFNPRSYPIISFLISAFDFVSAVNPPPFLIRSCACKPNWGLWDTRRRKHGHSERCESLAEGLRLISLREPPYRIPQTPIE